MSPLNNNSANLGTYCRSIGLLYDLTSDSHEPICSVFLAAEKKVASLASLVLPFAKNPEALKIVFPYADRQFGVSNIHFHAKFDRTLTRKTIFHGTLGNAPEAALQKYNCSVLELSDNLSPVTEALKEQVSESLRFPLNLADDGLRGSLQEIELPLVIQTLNGAKKQGILYICDEMYRPLAQIYCQGGRVVAAKYRALMNEMALFQIVEKRITGRFVFRACKPPAWMPAQTITRTTDSILIEAMRRQDESANLKKHLSINDFYFVRAYKQLYLDGVSQENRQAVEMIWRALDGTTPADQLWCLVPLDDYTIFTALNEMYVSNQCMRVPLAGTAQFIAPKMPDDAYAPAFLSATPLPLGIDLPLNAFDTISSVSIDPLTSRPRVKVGALLGAIDPYDAEHLLHDIPLLPYVSGSPLIKDDLVIGMHCGVVPSSSSVDNAFGVLQQLLWCDSIAQVLGSIPGTAIPPPIPVAAPQPAPHPAAAAASQAAPATAAKAGAAPHGDMLAATIPEPIDISQLELKKKLSAEAAANASAQNLPAANPAPSASTPLASAGTALQYTDQEQFESKKRLPVESLAEQSNTATVKLAAGAGNPVDQGQFDSKKRRPLDTNSPTKSLPGCREIASLKCGICGERTFSSARRCMRCLHEFVPQARSEKAKGQLDLAWPLTVLLILVVAVGAYLVSVRLPNPVFADVVVMSLPDPVWVEAVIKAGVQIPVPGQKLPRPDWEAQPNNAKLQIGRVVHLYCKANKACYLHLLYKGSSSGASQIKLDRESLSAGDYITYPPTILVVSDKGPSLKGIVVQGAAGADEFIVLASPNETLPWLDEASTIDEVFQKANAAIKLSNSKNGVLVSERQIMPDNSPDNNSTNKGQVFITSVTVYH